MNLKPEIQQLADALGAQLTPSKAHSKHIVLSFENERSKTFKGSFMNSVEDQLAIALQSRFDFFTTEYLSAVEDYHRANNPNVSETRYGNLHCYLRALQIAEQCPEQFEAGYLKAHFEKHIGYGFNTPAELQILLSGTYFPDYLTEQQAGDLKMLKGSPLWSMDDYFEERIEQLIALPYGGLIDEIQYTPETQMQFAFMH
ncbi:hypothetical protein ACMXYX_18130 (plasmid) [Neptuniibacter sp. QD72_48]|uniref:hypothetical protein n=1 Tax=Neptuniibacter sp. QD72_48 TaxID=3398214 RepID=UPI0039F46513